ncbi:sensor histidine kinase [Roseobacter sp. HKCCA0434]|uniref:sensor histidine kinase n=1 Tax=Roseobacter sp. HKCCA0434 TaxID=3079297 RepID=UPI002905D840|nr:GAF domain-containing protein [Roseobacter sp. HKCCA0434]
MTTTRKHREEEDRLDALVATGLLDSAREERFDRYTRLAGALTGCPIALISLIDDRRQWFKSRVGLAVSETPRSDAFCDFTIQHQRTMIVEDALNDPRFVNNPLVTGDPQIRFYAGVPLWLRSGHCIGSLCVIDTKPRRGDEIRGIAELEDLASTLLIEIEAHVSDALSARRLADQEVVIAELKHRMGNLYSNIGALIRNSDDGTLSHAEFMAELQGRLGLMANAQRRLADRDFASADLAALIGDAVRDFGGAGGYSDQVTLTGKTCEVGARGAMSIALLINELGTNAIKHGALRDEGGRVRLSWGVEKDGSFHIDWVEDGSANGPRSERQGFGATLLRKIIPAELGGTLDQGFGPRGYFYKLSTNANRLLAVAE